MSLLGISKRGSAERSQSGFSFLELLVVTAILTVISGIILTIMFRMTKAEGTVFNRTEMHAGVRSATELLQQEVGQAGKLALPVPVASPVTLSAAVAGNGTSQTPAVSSSSGMFPGEQLVVGPDATNGSAQETVSLTAVGANTITAVFESPHAIGAPVTVLGTFGAGVIPPCGPIANDLTATPFTCPATPYTTVTASAAGVLSQTNLTATTGSTPFVLKLFGDIEGDGNIVYIEYWCNTGTAAAPGNLYRNEVTSPFVGGPPSKGTVAAPQANGPYVLVPNILGNIAANTISDVQGCFNYQTQSITLNGLTNYYVTDVTVTLTVQTQTKDPSTGQFQQETKALLNVSPRNLFLGWQEASMKLTTHIQPVPVNICCSGTSLAGQTIQ